MVVVAVAAEVAAGTAKANLSYLVLICIRSENFGGSDGPPLLFGVS